MGVGQVCLILISVIAFALYIVAIVMQQWHTYDITRTAASGNTNTYTVGWGLAEACVNSTCYEYSDHTLETILKFDPCHIFADKSDIKYCEKRVATYGCMLSAAVCAFLAIIASFNSLLPGRKGWRGWGSYYFCGLFNFVAFLEALAAVVVYATALSDWNSQTPTPTHDFNYGTSITCAGVGALLTLICLVVSAVLAVRDRRKQQNELNGISSKQRLTEVSVPSSNRPSEMKDSELHRLRTQSFA